MLCVIPELFLERLTLWWRSLRASDSKVKTSHTGASSYATCFCKKQGGELKEKWESISYFLRKQHPHWMGTLIVDEEDRQTPKSPIWGLREDPKGNQGMEGSEVKVRNRGLAQGPKTTAVLSWHQPGKACKRWRPVHSLFHSHVARLLTNVFLAWTNTGPNPAFFFGNN